MNAYGVGLGTRLADLRREPQDSGPAKPRIAKEPVHARFGKFELDEANARLLADGQPVEIAPKPFALLCALARRPGSLRVKNDLLDEVWGHRFVTESVLKTAIGKLRIALQDDARTPRFIETVARRGYRFIAADGAAAVPNAGARDVATLSPERALHQIGELLKRSTGRKPLLLLIDDSDGGERAAAQLMDYIARWTPGMPDDVALFKS